MALEYTDFLDMIKRKAKFKRDEIDELNLNKVALFFKDTFIKKKSQFSDKIFNCIYLRTYIQGILRPSTTQSQFKNPITNVQNI